MKEHRMTRPSEPTPSTSAADAHDARLMTRRNALRAAFGATAGLVAAPMINIGRYRLFARSTQEYSARCIALMQQSVVIDMLSPLTIQLRQGFDVGNPDAGFVVVDCGAIRSVIHRDALDARHLADPFTYFVRAQRRQQVAHFDYARFHRVFLPRAPIAASRLSASVNRKPVFIGDRAYRSFVDCATDRSATTPQLLIPPPVYSTICRTRPG
jgi:hypothetical protein